MVTVDTETIAAISSDEKVPRTISKPTTPPDTALANVDVDGNVLSDLLGIGGFGLDLLGHGESTGHAQADKRE